MKKRYIKPLFPKAPLVAYASPSNKEVDLLLEFPDYYYAFEIKMTSKVNKVDAKHLFNLEEILNKPVKKAFVLSNDEETKYFDNKTIAIHAAMFLG